MKLILDCTGGFAGDMFTAALIDAGADFNIVHNAMIKSGEKLGDITIKLTKSSDHAARLNISLNLKNDHIGENKIREFLNQSFDELGISEQYRLFGNKVLENLIDAESEAHKSQIFEALVHHHSHNHTGTVLHEAQDILIDIVGAAVGMESLKIIPSASLTGQVATGKGKVKFSHGILDIPAPATKILLNKYNIQWENGEVNSELCTPTGAAILATLTDKSKKTRLTTSNIILKGYSRGTKSLPIPPLKLYAVENS